MARFQRFLAENIFSMAHGMGVRRWARFLWRYRQDVDPGTWPRLTFVTAMTALESVVAGAENWLYTSQIQATNVRGPIFILGHWRSGTTLLHNLLARDPQFAAPTLLQTLYPRSFRLLALPLSLFGVLLPHTRLIDNVAFGFDQPQEDEFALCNATLMSPYAGWILPEKQDHFDRYLSLADLSPQEFATWQDALLHFVRKVTWHRGQRLVLKSPTHTGRIRHLLSLFPDAQFVHISRDPYRVFQSTRHLHRVMWRAMAVQRTDNAAEALDELILQRYRTLYDLFFAERGLIPPGAYYELRFEDLVQDPVHSLEKLYHGLGLPCPRPTPAWWREMLTGYRQNSYPPLPEALKERIRRQWQRSFQAWGYDLE